MYRKLRSLEHSADPEAWTAVQHTAIVHFSAQFIIMCCKGVRNSIKWKLHENYKNPRNCCFLSSCSYKSTASNQQRDKLWN